SSASFDPRALKLAWTSPPNYSTPMIVGDSVIATRNGQGVGSMPTEVTSFRLSDGAINWSYSNFFTFPSQAGYGAGMVAIAAPLTSNFNDVRLYVLDATTGALK